MKFIKRLATPLILLMTLAACGGGGGGGGGASGNTPVTRGGNVLFVGDTSNNAIAALTTLTPAAGSNLAANVLGTNRNDSIRGMAYDDTRDRLYTSDGIRIAVYDRASTLNGTITPARYIDIPRRSTNLFISQLMLDKTRDRLYVAYDNFRFSDLAVLDNASTLNGNVSPQRVITDIPNWGSMAVDTQRAILYTVQDGVVRAYAQLDTLNGRLPAARELVLPQPARSGDSLAVDPVRNRLYIAERNVGVLIVNNPDSILQGTAVTSSVILATVPSPNMMSSIAVDPRNDRLYVGLSNQVFIMSEASRLNANGSANAVLVNAPSNSDIGYIAF